MNIRHAIIIAALFAAPVAAADQTDIRALAEHSGLSESQVRMVLNGRTVYHNRYPLYFNRAERQLISALGKDDYKRLIAGQSIQIQRPNRAPADTAVAQRTPK